MTSIRRIGSSFQQLRICWRTRWTRSLSFIWWFLTSVSLVGFSLVVIILLNKIEFIEQMQTRSVEFYQVSWRILLRLLIILRVIYEDSSLKPINTLTFKKLVDFGFFQYHFLEWVMWIDDLETWIANIENITRS